MMHAPTSNLPIVFEEVSVRAGAIIILNRVKLEIASGPPTILVGPNGSGKTTLLRVAMGLLPPSSGRVTWGGQEIGVPFKRAILFQRPTMLRRSAAANIRYALKAAGIPRGEQDEHVHRLLQLVGLADLAGRPARQMSGGEQQRLALARALARDPTVLFLDEPTASLDPAATKALEDIILTVVDRGIKVVMSTHDLGEARRLAGDIVLLHQGQVIEHDSALAFFNAPQTREAKAFIAGELLTERRQQ